MSSGRNSFLTRTTGEYLVCVELGRRGWIGTTFTGSLPKVDILAFNEQFEALLLQVKAKRKGDWLLRADSFLDINYNKETKVQAITGKKKDPGIVYIFVKVTAPGKDEFYIVCWPDLQEIILEDYSQHLKKWKGVRPKNSESKNFAVSSEHVSGFRDNWSLLDKREEKK